jgi:hypothetical protein
MSTKAQHRAKAGLPPLVFGPQWADMLRHAYVQPVLAKARQAYIQDQAQKALIPKPLYTVAQDAVLASLVESVPFDPSNDISALSAIGIYPEPVKPKRKYVRKAKVEA